MKPRGLMIIHQFRPIIGGAELQAERLAIKLFEMGHGIEVLTSLRVPGSLPEEILQGVKVHRVPFRLAYWVLRGGVLNTFKYLVDNLDSYDVLHVHQAFGHAIVAVIVARFYGKKCIIKIACTGEYGDLHVFSRFRWAGWGVRAMRHADAIVAISREVENELLRWGFPRDRIVRIPNGVDAAFFRRVRPFPETTKVRFVLLGRRHPQKGIDVAIEAAKRLKAQGVGDRFEIKMYGGDYQEYDYRGLAKTLGVADIVEFLPHQDGMRDVLETMHCLILPSRGEGLSNALLEAMAMEMPVIATTVSGTMDVVDDGVDGILIPAESPDALAEAMASVIQDPDLRVRLGQNARQKVESEYSLDVIASRYSDLYQQLCKS